MYALASGYSFNYCQSLGKSRLRLIDIFDYICDCGFRPSLVLEENILRKTSSVSAEFQHLIYVRIRCHRHVLFRIDKTDGAAFKGSQ